MNVKPETAAEVLAQMFKHAESGASTTPLRIAQWASRIERALLAPPDGELVQRLLLHAEMHGVVSPFDAEQAQWERDLREAAMLLSAPARVPSMKFTITEARKLVAFFGGHDAEVTVELHPDRIDNDRMHFAGLYAYVTDYPEEGCEYLGPIEVQDDDETAAPARVTEEMVERFVDAYVTDLPDPRVAIRDALTAALEADHE